MTTRSTAKRIAPWLAIVLIVIFVVPLAFALGGYLGDQACEDKCVKQADDEIGPAGDGPFIDIHRWFYIGNCMFFCTP